MKTISDHTKIKTIQRTRYSGVIQVPPSKSYSQRALLIASLCPKTSIIRNVGKSTDELAMISNIRKLGATVKWKDDQTLLITGNPSAPFPKKISCGESGLGLRLLTCLAATRSETVELTGTKTLKSRDHSFFDRYLGKMGVKVKSNGGKVPISVTGKLQAGTYHIDGTESSQYISGLLIAFSQIEGKTTLIVDNLASQPYAIMTMDCLNAFGHKIILQQYRTCNPPHPIIDKEIYYTTKAEFDIYGQQVPLATDYTIEGDWSSAAYWIVATSLGINLTIRGLNLSSIQPDRNIFNIEPLLEDIIIDFDMQEIRFLKYSLCPERRAFSFDATACPDLFPALVAYASVSQKIPLYLSLISGVHRLINKESNRVEALIEEFTKLGVDIQIHNDTMYIRPPEQIRRARVNSHNDHRIAMALAIVAMASGVELEIENTDVVAKSYPNFWNDLESLRTEIQL